ncbi:hypothetical protein AVEN_43746-1 [Araneus ventricosus]|uniref:Uncharacterized protein n=1 Tax=Araneus ventricosus TaxID=182803 RepID=A0A4Y2BYN4_ARAVE|nr:hypothetical protein AVEN_43746-1 [Araneus ventricosus]
MNEYGLLFGADGIIQFLFQAGNSSVDHSIRLSQHCFFPTHSSRQIHHVIHLKLQSGLAVGESDLLLPSTSALQSTISPISDKGSLVARSESSQNV